MGRLRHPEWVASGIVCLTIVWLVLLMTGSLHQGTEAIKRYVPSWFPAVNLILYPVFAGLVFLRHSLTLRLRLVSGALLLLSASVLGLSAQKYPILGMSIGLLVLLEIYWIIPKLDEGWQRKRRPFKNV